MQLFKQIERLNLLDKLISQKKTGNPECLARRLNLSVSRLARIIEFLREAGAPIQYDRTLQTYFYEYDYQISIQVSMQPLSDHDTRLYEAGGFFTGSGIHTCSFKEILQNFPCYG